MQYNIQELRESVRFKDIPLFVAYIRDRIKADPSLLQFSIFELVDNILFGFRANYDMKLVSAICMHVEDNFFKRIYLPLDDATINQQITQAKLALEDYTREVLCEL
jgi:hypothetical protein